LPCYHHVISCHAAIMSSLAMLPSCHLLPCCHHVITCHAAIMSSLAMLPSYHLFCTTNGTDDSEALTPFRPQLNEMTGQEHFN
jgi:hypothetical protein